MKKMLALLLTIALMISAVTLTALAGETTETATDEITSATVPNGSGQTPGGGQMPQLPDQSGKNRQQPQTPGNDQNGQSGQNGQQGMPGRGNGNMKRGDRNTNGRQAGGFGEQQIFDQLLKDGIITQEVYDAIMNYLKEQGTQQPGNSTVPSESSEPPALPDGTAPAAGSEPPAAPEGKPDVMEQQMLKEWLEKGVITQEQYEEILSKLTPVDAAETNGNL